MADQRPRRALNEQPGLDTPLLLELVSEAPPSESSVRKRHPFRVEELLGRLSLLGLVDETGAPTPLAQELAPFLRGNVSVRWAVCLGASRHYGTTWDACTVVALLAADSPFFVYPSESREEACAAHQAFEQEGSGSDLITLLCAFMALERVMTNEGETRAAEFARGNFLNFGTFLQARRLAVNLRRTAEQLGWNVEDHQSSEEALTATFFWGFFDRLLRRDENSWRWQSVHRFFAEIQRDSLHHANRNGDAELVLCVGLIWKTGDPSGKAGGATFNAIAPEAVQELVGDAVGFVIEPRRRNNGQADEACDVWYWAEDRLATRISPMPDGTPLQVLQQGHARSNGQLALPARCAPEATWDDLARKTNLPDLKARVASIWLDFPDKVRIGEMEMPVRYEEGTDGTIVVIIAEDQAVHALPELSMETLPDSWSERPIVIAVDTGDGSPLMSSIHELDQLRELLY